jgi:hypothetical protein
LKTLLIFIDGLGIGKKDKNYNPLFFTKLPNLSRLFNGEIPSCRNRYLGSDLATLIPADARFGVKGLPQSGTGQTSIFCGINAPKIIGKHFGPYPYSTLVPIINEKNIFAALKLKKKKVAFLNAYPKQFFDYLASGRTRLTVTSMSCIMSGVRLCNSSDLENGKALSADITNENWHKFGHNVKTITPYQAGKRLYKEALKHDFSLYEYFYTDHAGHSQQKEFSSNTLIKLDGLLGGLCENYDPQKLFVFIVSDHGNIEDLSTKSHTLNPVPIILMGNHKEKYVKHIKSIADIYHQIIQLVDVNA